MNLVLTLLLLQQPSTAEISAARRATVLIQGVRSSDTVTASGFIVTATGLIATATAALGGVQSGVVRLSTGETYPIEGVAFRDEQRGFVLLRIAGFALPVVRFGNSDSATAARRVWTIAMTRDGGARIVDGKVASERIEGGTRVWRLALTLAGDARGAAVMGSDGRVIGLVTSDDTAPVAIPLNYVRGQLELAGRTQPVALQETAPQRDWPATVNDSLKLDWNALAGSQIHDRWDDSGIRYHTFVDYSRSRTPDDVPTIERHSTVIAWRLPDSLQAGDYLYREDDRTVIRLDSSRTIDVFRNRTAWHKDYQPSFTYELRIAGGTATLDSGGKRITATVPAGVLPATLEGATIAAVRSLGAAPLFFWELESGVWPPKILSVRVDIGASRTADVSYPIGFGDHHCSLIEKVDVWTRLATVQTVILTKGASRLERSVLADAPHLEVSNAVCVRVPGS